MEAIGPGRVGIARFRSGATPPMMPDQRITISDLLIFAPDTTRAAEEQPRTLEDVLPRAFGTTTVDRRTPLGLYWETYGLGRTDTAIVALTAEREGGGEGVLQRLGMALGLVDRPSGVTVRYALEPSRAGGGSTSTAGQALSIGLNALAPGNYNLKLEVSVSGQELVTSKRAITIR
jgi:hypothetical protein